MTRVSSANRTFESVLFPAASAARISARLVMLLDPGGLMDALKGRVTGSIATSLISAPKYGMEARTANPGGKRLKKESPPYAGGLFFAEEFPG